MNSTEQTAYIAFGGNLGSPSDTLRAAIPLISERIGRVDRVSSLYETKALTLDGVPQPNYLNAVVSVLTTLEPQAILQHLLAVEQLLGRNRSLERRWEPRAIDLDLLFVDDRVESSAALTLPHPELENRDFVLQPLAEIAAEFVHPVARRRVALLLEDLLQQGRERFVIQKIATTDA